MNGLKKSDSIDGRTFLASAKPYQHDLEGDCPEKPENDAMDERFDAAGPFSRRNDPAHDRRPAVDRRACIKLGMLHRPGQDAGRHGPDDRPESDARLDVDPPS
jgi:hypothetical protein